MYDVIIVGGGPAGLSAAIVLGRCLRRVLVCDAGRPRNIVARAMHGYLTRDGISPAEFLRIARKELDCYQTVEVRDVAVTDVACLGDRFEAVLRDGARFEARKMLLATGVEDHLPDLQGMREFYGKSVFHCPYCDGWELRGQPIAVYGKGSTVHGLAITLTRWSRDLALCTDGPAELSSEQSADIERLGISLRETRIARLEGRDGMLERIVFADGARLERRALFFSIGQRQRCDLPAKIGCEFNEKGTVRTGQYEQTRIPGLFAAGDASEDVQFVVVAAAEGAQAAVAINKSLMLEDLGKPLPAALR